MSGKKMFKPLLITVALAVSATCAWTQQSPRPGTPHQPHFLYQRGAAPQRGAAATATAQQNMMYFGGQVLSNSSTYAFW